MSRQKRGKENIRKLQWSNRSYCVALPIELVREFGWRERQKLVVEKYGKDKLIIRDWSPKQDKKK